MKNAAAVTQLSLPRNLDLLIKNKTKAARVLLQLASRLHR